MKWLILLFLCSCSTHPVKKAFVWQDSDVSSVLQEVCCSDCPKVEFVEFTDKFVKTRAMYGVDEKTIFIDLAKWKKSDVIVKRLILLHELGHFAKLPHPSIESCMEKPQVMCHSLKLVEANYRKDWQSIEKKFIKDLKQILSLGMHQI